MRGGFIVIEGPDGSGTTSHSKLLVERLQAMGTDALWTAEPSGGPIGKDIRTHLKEGSLPFDALQLMFCADRAWHLEKEVIPALESGKTVICDRYIPSTVIYGGALGLDEDWLLEVNKKFIQPDAMLFLLPPLSVCMERVGGRAAQEILEEDSLQKKVYEGYERFAKSDPAIRIVDTSGEKEAVSAEILSFPETLRPLRQA